MARKKFDRKAALAKIHIIAKELGLTDDDYRGVLFELTGKESCAKMRVGELKMVLDHFATLSEQMQQKAQPKIENPPKQDQLRLIYFLAKEHLGPKWRSRLTGLCEKTIGVSAPEWADKDKLINVVAALSKIIRLEERRKKMLYEKLMSVHNAIGVFADRVDRDSWAVLRLARDEIMDAAEVARGLENCMIGHEKERCERCKEMKDER